MTEPDLRDIRSPSLNATAAAAWTAYARHMTDLHPGRGAGPVPRYLGRPWDKLAEDEQYSWVEAAKAVIAAEAAIFPPAQPGRTQSSVLENRIEDLCQQHGWEWRAELVTATGCAWSAEVWIVMPDPDPDGYPYGRSLVTRAGGGTHPETAMDQAIDKMLAWLDEPDHPPVPVFKKAGDG